MSKADHETIVINVIQIMMNIGIQERIIVNQIMVTIPTIPTMTTMTKPLIMVTIPTIPTITTMTKPLIMFLTPIIKNHMSLK